MANIKGGFAGAGLHPLDPTRVLKRLYIRISGPMAGPATGPMAGPVTGPLDGSATGPMAGPATGPLDGRTPSPRTSPGPYKTPYNLNQLTAYTNHLHQ